MKSQPIKKKLFDLPPGTEFEFERTAYRVVTVPSRTVCLPWTTGKFLDLKTGKLVALKYGALVFLK